MCGKPHPTVLHYDPNDDKELGNQEKIEVHEDCGSSNVSSVCHQTVGDQANVTNSMSIPVGLHHKDNPQREILVYALLDDASETTFDKSQTLRDLGLCGPDIKLNLHTMLGKEEIIVERMNNLVVKRVDKRVAVELPKTYSRTRIPHRKNQTPTPDVASKWLHLEKIVDKLCPYQSNTDVALLIGCNCLRAIKPREVILGKGDNPYAVRTLLGWGIIGPVTPYQDEGEEAEFATCNRIMSCEIGNDAPSDLQFIPVAQSQEEITPYAVKKMFEADSSERGPAIEALSKEERKFLTIVVKGIHHCEDGHYEMPLPLRVPNLNLPNNREVAVRRQLKERFVADSKYKEDYTMFMETVIKKGFAEKVPPKCRVNEQDVWYIPHHGVYHSKKPDKIRLCRISVALT